jgi:hypothetical protein
MARVSQSIDKVRASRDGHEYHEAWTARKAMQLLLPNDNLVGIAVEGLEPGDQARASPETVEVADLTLYYGRHATFKGATRVEIVQFKYSIGREDVEFRASDARKTIAKFAAAYQEHKTTHSPKKVQDKLQFELITNRPIYAAFEEAIAGIADGKTLSGAARAQANQFKSASGLDGAPLKEFAGKFQVIGLSGNLADTKRGLSRMLVDWSATSDAQACARLGDMRQMVRDKGGHIGTNRNVIRRTDVIATLGIAYEGELLPCPAVLANVGKIVEREQLPDAIALVPQLSRPLLIHSAGGVGKTVFMQSLASSLRDEYEIVFFDCFGGAGPTGHPKTRGIFPNEAWFTSQTPLPARVCAIQYFPEATMLKRSSGRFAAGLSNLSARFFGSIAGEGAPVVYRCDRQRRRACARYR